ncbi:hypothetical protein [Flavihumibacter sp. UBA7668]|uniref:hypothetical protein n=1 Tax=Flavihumibacter sp. UBA7668 TaxID=1946542 RepID=UPI0025BD3720|nr:hypothetical protein [Flavihumibacter sp. UBA7668]
MITGILKRITLFAYSFLFSCAHSLAQDSELKRIIPKEFSIPASPVFDLMGVTPSQINRTSDIRDFKVDWSFKSWKLSPNLAIQSQPVWEILYNKKKIEKYQQASGFMRKLASLDLSVGSVQDENNDRRIGFAIKMNLYKEKDPFMDKELFAGVEEQLTEEENRLTTELEILVNQLDTMSNLLEKTNLRSQVTVLQTELLSIPVKRKEELQRRSLVFIQEHWNASSVDVSFGKIYSYITDSAGSLKSLRLNRNTGWGGWINGNIGIGKRLLLSGMFRSTFYDELLEFTLSDASTGEEIPGSAIASNQLFAMGMNLRYGGSLFTFFAEFLYERKKTATALQALNDRFTPPEGFVVKEGTLKWDGIFPNALSVGGDWRISRNLMINYGMRCSFDKNWTFRVFSPVVTLSCMMR